VDLVRLTKPYQNFAAEGVFVDLPHGASQRHVAYLLRANAWSAAPWRLRFMHGAIRSARCRRANTFSIMP